MTDTFPRSGPAILDAILVPGTTRDRSRAMGRVALFDADGNPIDLAAGSQGPKGDQGPVGPAGPTGPAGAPGAPGAQGASGGAGPKGDPGVVGATGAQGLKGDKGDKGDTGVGVAGPQGQQGPTGSTGPQGAAGIEGPKGDPGAQGGPGAQGATGAQGVKGDTGPQGGVGAQGPTGAPGATGPTGATGPKGDKGDVGNAILNCQSKHCQDVGYRSASFAGTTAYHVIELSAVLGAPSMIITVPSQAVAFWLEAHHQNGLIRKDDSAYHYIYSGIRLTPADEDGLTIIQSVITEHATVDNYMSLSTHKRFRCKAGQAYTIEAIMGAGSGGTWNYSKSSALCFLETKAIAL